MPLEELRTRLHTLPERPDVIRIAGRTTTAPGASASRTETRGPAARQLRRRHRLVAGAGPADVRRLLLEGELDDEMVTARMSAAPRSRTTTSRASPWPRCSAGRCRSDGCATRSASSSRRERSDRSAGCTRTATASIASHTASRSPCIGDDGNSPTSAAGAATRRSTARPRSCCATPAGRTVCSRGPLGGNERQFCSPAFNLPMGTLQRTRMRSTTATTRRPIAGPDVAGRDGGRRPALLDVTDVLETEPRW